MNTGTSIMAQTRGCMAHRSLDFGPVAFPGSEPVPKQPEQPRPHLPFRRISLPTAPTILHRHSVVSVASFDSHPEEEGQQSALRSPGKRRTRLESPRRRERSTKPDPSRLLKRRKIVDELYETEKTYVEGLDLVYTVRALNRCRD
jgi:FYVE, RhoGEF and PH domain containing 5/6